MWEKTKTIRREVKWCDQRKEVGKKEIFISRYHYTLFGTIRPYVPRYIETSGHTSNSSSTFIIQLFVFLHVHFFAAGSGGTCKAELGHHSLSIHTVTNKESS